MSTSSRKKGRSLFFYIIPCIILLGIAVFIFIKPKQPAIRDTQLYNSKAPSEETVNKTPPQEEKPVTAPLPQITAPENAAPVLTVDEVQMAEETTPDECDTKSEAIFLLLSHLSEQEYIKAYELNENLADYINKITIKLLNNPPEITSESNDLLSILKNAAHFYRVLGPKDVSLLKDILLYEGDGIESMFADFYQWSLITDECQDPSLRFSLPLKKSYEYACFFLNTLGGQSYLFRRESRTRILIKYYSLLILDAAERHNLNRYNFDITEMLPSTIEDLNEAHFLINKDQYIENLLQIQKRLSSKI